MGLYMPSKITRKMPFSKCQQVLHYADNVSNCALQNSAKSPPGAILR